MCERIISILLAVIHADIIDEIGATCTPILKSNVGDVIKSVVLRVLLVRRIRYFPWRPKPIPLRVGFELRLPLALVGWIRLCWRPRTILRFIPSPGLWNIIWYSLI